MKYVLGFLAGAIFGAMVALLYAPSSGDELRMKIKNQAEGEYSN